MEASRDDVGIAIRSAFLKRGTQQRFSLLVLVLLSIAFIFIETIESKPLNYLRAFIKDSIYRGSLIVSSPSNGIRFIFDEAGEHINLYKEYNQLKQENEQLKNKISETDYLVLENTQLRRLIDEQIKFPEILVSSKVMLDKQSPYLNSFILNTGINAGIKNGMAALHGKNFIGRIVDVNFFSSRVLLISDLNSRIPVVIEPSGTHAILSGKGTDKASLEHFPENHKINEGDKVYTSGKEGIFSPGIPIGEVEFNNGKVETLFFSDLDQITYVNIVSANSKLNQ